MNGTILVAIVFLCFFATAFSSGAEPYRLPPDDIVDIVDAKPSPSVDISPDGEWMLQVERDSMPTIEDVARRMLRLAGMRIDPAANARFRTTFDKSLSLRRRDDPKLLEVPLPNGARLSSVSWAHDSKSFAYSVVTKSGSELWAASVDSPNRPKQLTHRLMTVTEGYQWMPSADRIVCVLVPAGRGEEPAAPVAPSGPNVQETSGETSPTRTYQDLLTSAHDESVFEHFTVGQLAIIDLQGKTTNVGKPGIIWSVEPAPGGEFLLVTKLQKPFSYLLTARSFPQTVEVWDQQGNVVHQVAEIPLAENIPIEGVRLGPRQISWRTGLPASITWFEAMDGGDPRVEAKHRDRLMQIDAPFEAEPKELLRLEHRAVGTSALSDENQLITFEYDRDRRWIRSLLQDLGDDGESPKVLMDRSVRDRYGDPGSMVTEADETGHSVVLQRGPWVFRSGMGASPEGNLPFLDRQNLETLETERLWRCEKERFEFAIAVIGNDDDGANPSAKDTVAFITQGQSPDDPPNYFWHGGSEPKALTVFPDPTPQIRNIKKQLVKYERADGIPLSATLYLPADHKEGEQLPLLIWAYPVEFNDASTAGQVSSSPWRFTTIRGSSHLALLAKGYAIMDGATMPIVGHPETMNDTFIEQLVASAQAAIDKAVEMGVADRNRIAVGGHSYGAFMTANLLAHCDLFRAGIARSGAYNRTLTPFGFQSERRPLWEARDIYYAISPFMHADKIKDPLLMFHGEEDNNSGTFPLQSKRLFQAIKGNGGTARLVMLPEESHGYRARESVMHVQAESLEWLDKYVKNAGPREKPEGSTEADTRAVNSSNGDRSRGDHSSSDYSSSDRGADAR